MNPTSSCALSSFNLRLSISLLNTRDYVFFGADTNINSERYRSELWDGIASPRYQVISGPWGFQLRISMGKKEVLVWYVSVAIGMSD